MIKLRRINFMKFVSLSVILSLFMQIFLPLIPLVKLKISAEGTPESYPVSYVDNAVPESSESESVSEPVETESASPIHYLEDKKETFKNIVVGEQYVYTLNSEVKISFSSIPSGENYFTIEEVDLIIDNQTTKGFDFNTNMENGSFEYSMLLPNDYGMNATVRYSEDGTNFQDLNQYIPSADSISLNADHFTVFIVVPDDLIPSNMFYATQQGWRFSDTGNAITELVSSVSKSIPNNFGPDVVGMSRTGGSGNNRSYLGYFEENKKLQDIESISWNRYSRLGSDTYLNIYLQKGFQFATVVYNPSVTLNTWELNIFNNSSSNIQVRKSGVTTTLTFAQLMTQYGNWNIWNDSLSIGGIVIVSGSTSPTSPQEHYIDGVTVDFAGQSPQYYDFVQQIPAQPSIEILQPQSGQYVRGLVNVRARITDSGYGLNPNQIWAKFSDGVSPNEFGATLMTLVSGETDLYEANIDTLGFNGLYSVGIDVIDNIGMSRSAKMLNVWVDNINPILTVKPSPDTIGSNGMYKIISFKLYDNYLIDKVVINGVTTDMTNNQWSDANDIIPGNYWGAVEGQNTITLYDVAGNSSSHDFILDTTAPQISFAGFRDQLNGSYDAGQPIKVCGSYNKSGFIAWEWNLLTTEANPVTYSYLITQGPVAVGYSATTTNTHYNGGIPQEGYYEVEVWATDLAGNSSQRVECSVTYDKTAPSVPTIIFPNESDAFNAIPILNDWTDSTDGVSGIENYRVEYAYDDGHSFSGGPYRYATLSQRNHIPNTTEEGGVKFRVQAIDKAGNEGEWSDWRHYYYDITVPSSSFENPLDDQYLNSAIDLSGSTFDNTGVKEVYLEYSVAGANAWSSIVTLNNSLNNSPFSWNYSWTPTLNGVYDIRVRAKDIAGNIESTDYVYNLTFDTNAPSVPLNGTPDNQVIPTNSFNFYWDESSDNLTQAHNIRYIFQSSLNPSQVGGVLTTNLWTSPTLMDPMIVSAGAPDGKWYWQVRAIDETGNMSDWSEIWDVTLDTTAPAKPTGLRYFDPSTSSVLSCGVSIQPKSIWPQWNANSESDFSHYEYTSFDVASNPQGWTIGLNEQVMTGTQFAHSWVPPVDGVYGYAIRSVDQVGNKSDWALGGTKTLEDSCEYTVDGTAPVAPQLVSPPDNSFVKGNSITQSWTASDSDTQFYIYESYNDSLATSLRWHEQFTSTSKTATNVGDAIYWWRVKAVDEVGNESPWSNLWKITVDNTKPVTMIDESLEGGYFNSDIEIFGTTTDNYGVEEVYLYYKLKEAEDIESNWVYLATIENVAQDLPFNWTYIWSHSLDDGEYTIRANAVDLAGNIESTDYSNITIDKTAPTLELQELVEKIEGVNMPELQEFIAENPEELEISCTPSLSELSTLVDEDTNIEVTCSVTDKAGNKTTKTTTLKLTNNSPVVTIGVSPSAVTTSNITLTANLVGGNAPFTYSWNCSSVESSNIQTLVLSTVGTRNCSVTVTDNDGDSSTANGSYTINAVQVAQQNAQNNSNQNATGGSVLGEDALAQASVSNEIDSKVLGATTQVCDIKRDISGFIYLDSDKDNIKDSSEQGLSNVKISIVTISENEDGGDRVIEVATIYTNNEGKWEATLCPGEYIVMPDSKSLPEGGSLLDSTLSLTVENDKDLTNQNFAVAGVSVDTNSTNTADINWWVIILIILAIVGVTGGVYYFSKRNPA